MKRLFLAFPITLDEHYLKLRTEIIRQYVGNQITWVDTDLQHITLRFIGKTPENKIEQIGQIMSSIAQSTLPVTLSLDKLGVFGSRYAPAALWFGFSDFTSLRPLFEKAETALQNIGFQPNEGNFVPHITLGRIKKIDNKKRFWEQFAKLQPSFKQPITIDQIILFQSKLTTLGPYYKVLNIFPLAKKPPITQL